MGWMEPTRGCAVVLLLLGGVGAAAQSSLPASGLPGSSLPATSPTALPVAAVAGPKAESRPVPAAVSYRGGEIEITANDSSLNQILREVSHLTGMVITGGVTEQRVYGKYGPASAGDVLTSLLEGTGTNILLIAGPSGVPQKLILTQRAGGPSPPNPNAPGFDDGYTPIQPPAMHNIDNPPEAQTGAAAAPVGARPGGTGGPVTTTGAGTASGSSGSGSSDSGNPASPNGVLTPQQIYQQLQQLQKAQPH
jgi:hypothetical protein